VIPFAERIEIVNNIKCVDQVEPQINMDKFAAWEKLRFNRMFVGDDWKGSDRWIQLEEKFAAEGVEIVYFPYTAHTSSTKLQEALKKLS
jgi:glycerol-3-phosphate cytidylyltransferase